MIAILDAKRYKAVIAMAIWASEQNGVNHVEAEIESNNKASQRVLLKAWFHLNGVLGEEGPRYVFRDANKK